MPPSAPGVTEPRAGTLEEGQVRAMFDRIAGVYDRMNAVMTAGLDRRWRARAADLAAVRPGDRALDVATGTGDLALELAGRVAPGGEVVGCDFAEEMLARARDKALDAPVPVRFEWANALALPYESGEFAAATVGFGARNFSDLGPGIAGGHGEVLARHGGDTIAAGGKRLRPLLVFIVAGEAPAACAGLVRAAVAVELIHSATLVHDDVLDGARLRRGRPTVVAAGGRGVATATGDLLFSRAFAELRANDRADEVRVLSRASTALALGELLQRADAFDATVPVERYLERCEYKTARLFEAACQLGALESAAPPDRVEALGAFGRRIGLAFQLLDDVLDVSGPAERTGKARGTDLLDGTVTLPLILARDHDPELAAVDVR